LSSPTIPFTTAGLRPDLFAGARARSIPRLLLAAALTILVIAGFGLRVTSLSSERDGWSFAGWGKKS